MGDRLLTISETAGLLRVSRSRARTLAERAGALWWVGAAPRVHQGTLIRALAAGDLAESAPPRRTPAPAEPAMPATPKRPPSFTVNPYRCSPPTVGRAAVSGPGELATTPAAASA